jgi:hypothetical protein
MAESIENEEDAAAFSQLWSEINGKFEDKAENTACVIKNLEADAKAIEEEEKRLRARRKKLETSAESLKFYLEYHMKTTDVQKVTGKLFTLAIQKNPPSLKLDQTTLNDKWWVVKREPDNAKIKDALKSGEKIDGAWLEQGESLRIR